MHQCWEVGDSLALFPEGYVFLTGLSFSSRCPLLWKRVCYEGGSIPCSSHILLGMSLRGAFSHVMTQEDGSQKMRAFEPSGQ